MAKPVGGYIPALDGLRALAIIPVTAYHYIGWNLAPTAAEPATILLSHLIDRGALGVTLFFALSGYLITGILLDAKGGANWIPLFLARRALRIFPLYYAALIAIFWIAPLLLRTTPHALYGRVDAHQGWLWIYGSNLQIMLENRWALCSAAPCANGIDLNHFWSLAVEERFYLLWPLVIWACSRRTSAWVALALSACAVGLRVYFLAARDGQWTFAAHVFTPCCMDALLLGALPAILLRDPNPLMRVRVLRWAPWFLLAPVLSFAIPEGLARQALVPTLQALAFSGLVVVCAHAPAQSRVARVLGAAPLVLIGRISYGIYVVHAPLHRVWAALVSPARLIAATGSTVLGLVLFWLMALGLSCLVAYASFHLFEKRMVALKRYLPGSTRELASASR